MADSPRSERLQLPDQMEGDPTTFDLLGDFFEDIVIPDRGQAPATPDQARAPAPLDQGQAPAPLDQGQAPVPSAPLDEVGVSVVLDEEPIDDVEEDPVDGVTAPTPRRLQAGEVFAAKLEDYSSDPDHLARLDGEPFREFLNSIDFAADATSREDLSIEELLAMTNPNASGDPSLGLLDGGGYAGDLLIIQSNYLQAISLLETTTFFFMAIVIVMIVVLMGIFVVIGLDWPVAISIIMVTTLFLYFASVAYRSVVAHSLGIARSDQIRAIVRVRRLARLNLTRTPVLLAWSQHLASRP